jgi:hypothetical protein
MVIARYLLVGIACLYASIAGAVTADELRDAAAQQDHEASLRQSRTDTGSIGSLLPGDPQTSSKYDTGAQSTNAKTAAKKRAAKKRAAKKHDAAAASGVGDVSNLYTPPPRSGAVSGGQAIVTDAVYSTAAFGIRLGSWLNASLDRNTTSGESGSVELTVTGDAIGDRRTLPAGTVLFADKNLNNTTKRMEMVVTHGITPAGQEFEMHGLVFDPQKTPGLAGVYVLDKKESVSRGAQKGAIAAVGAAVGMAGPGIAGAATNAAAQSVLNDAGTVTDNNAAQAVIYVSPQALLIRVEKQF